MAVSFDQQINEFNAVRSPAVVGLDDTNSGTSGFQYILKVYAWTGLIASKPATPQATFKKPPLSNTNAYFDIAKVVRGYVSHKTNPQSINGIRGVDGSMVNISLEAQWEAVGVDATGDSSASGFFGLDGYTDYTDGLNYGISGNELTNQPATISIAENGSEFLSFLWDDSSDVSGVKWIGKGGGQYKTNFDTFLGAKASITSANNKAGYLPIGASSLAAFAAAISPSNLDDVISQGLASVQLTDSLGDVIKTYNIETVCEAKYDIYTIYFINRFGVWDFLTCFKKSIETQTRMNSEFQRQAYNLSGENLSYDSSDSQFKQYNVNGRSNITVNTGYQNEGISELVRQIAMSEKVQLQKNDETPYPVNFLDSSLPIKSVVNDGLINYTINFVKAFKTINTMG